MRILGVEYRTGHTHLGAGGAVDGEEVEAVQRLFTAQSAGQLGEVSGFAGSNNPRIVVEPAPQRHRWPICGGGHVGSGGVQVFHHATRYPSASGSHTRGRQPAEAAPARCCLWLGHLVAYAAGPVVPFGALIECVSSVMQLTRLAQDSRQVTALCVLPGLVSMVMQRRCDCTARAAGLAPGNHLSTLLPCLV
jgi:hypothetical protein